MKRFVFLLAGIFILLSMMAQPPKREMRAGWLATVYRIDWPTTAMTSVTPARIAAQKAELIAILDSVQAANMNAVFFQIRPEADALYNSAYEPWSAHLGGDRGTYPGYDPTAFAIEEAHKRGIELHAWLNPYRFETSAKKYAGKHTDYRAMHPEWILDYATYNPDGSKIKDDITILDPGNPAVRKLIKNVVGDILSKYDLDGIIFDDYFYAYSGTNSTLDSYSQGLYKPTGKNLGDWRRENVNKMVADVYDTIQAIRPSVIFGVSPFGIWTTSSSVASSRGLTLPVGITGSNMYEQIYCDPVAWLEQGTVDYISPQVYWPTTSTGQDYKKLCPWWSDVAKKYDKYFYSSMSITALNSTYNAPKQRAAAPRLDLPADLHELKAYTINGGMLPGLTQTEQRLKAPAAIDFADSEVGLQINWNRNSTKNNAPGSVFYSIKHLRTNGNFTKYLREQKFQKPALTPAISWKTHPSLGSPANVRVEQDLLVWDFAAPNMRYAVYAIPNALVNNPTAFNTSDYLLGVSYAKSLDITKFTNLLSTHQFAVAVVDRFGNEFTPSFITTSTSMAGMYKVGVNEVAPNFASLSAAVTALNAATITGNVILAITSDITETANIGLGVDTKGFSITIRPDTDQDRTITFTKTTDNASPSGHFVIGYTDLTSAWTDANTIATNNVTIDGFALGGATRRLKLTTSNVSITNSKLTVIVGACENTTIKNCIYDNQSTASSAQCIGMVARKGTAIEVAPNGVVIDNNIITAIKSSSGQGINTTNSEALTSAKTTGLVVKNNIVTAQGRLGWFYHINGADFYDNEFHLIQSGSAGTVNYGLWTGTGAIGTYNIYNNRFVEISTKEAGISGTLGMRALSLGGGSVYNVYNNMFSGLDRKGSATAAVNQTYIFFGGTGHITHNTFYMPAMTANTTPGYYNAIHLSSANPAINNNIFISDEDAMVNAFYSAVSTSSVDNNIYYNRAGNAKSLFVAGTTLNTMALYQAANPTKDMNSKSVNVNFIDDTAGDLRITGASEDDADLQVPLLAAVPKDLFGTNRLSPTYAGAHQSVPFTTVVVPTAETSARIRTTATGIQVELTGKANIELYTINGVLLDKTIINGSYSRDLDNGMYIILINGKATKFIK